MKKTFKIIMLPTEEASRLFIDTRDNSLAQSMDIPPAGSIWPNQHLYILSDEEIKEGDWIYSTDNNTSSCNIYQVVKYNAITGAKPIGFGGKCFNTEQGIGVAINKCKKIIATTDKSLTAGINNCDGCLANKPIDNNGNHRMGNEDEYPDYMSCQKSKYIINLPQIPESFIKAYIKAYNEGNPITEVDLEMEEFIPGGSVDIMDIFDDHDIITYTPKIIKNSIKILKVL